MKENQWDDRPRYKGLVVPYSVQWFDGVPDFRVTNHDAIVNCVHNRVCGLCGHEIEKPELICFLGGTNSLLSRLFTDPGMHEACAKYSVEVCPFLNGTLTEMRDLEGDKAKNVKTNELVNPTRPKKFGLLRAHSCRFVRFSGEVVIQSGREHSIEWLVDET